MTDIHIAIREPNSTEVLKQTYFNSEKSALKFALINSMLSLIESYVDMPPNSSLKGCYKEVCVKEIDLFRVYIEKSKIGFTGGIQKQGDLES